MDLLIATSNPHKLEEIRAVFAPRGLNAIGLDDLPGGAAAYPEPHEDADTIEANARLKALAYARMTNRPCLADDSGLEVDALRGLPGVHSAYYAFWKPGMTGPPDSLPPRAHRDRLNNERLLRDLANVPDEKRTARFLCAMALATPDPAAPGGARITATSRGKFEGVIGHTPRGTNGFGYDPLVILEDGRTSAELSPEEKNARSHRGHAARAMANLIAPTR